MGLLSKERLRELIKEKYIKTVADIQSMLKEMFSETTQEKTVLQTWKDGIPCKINPSYVVH